MQLLVTTLTIRWLVSSKRICDYDDLPLGYMINVWLQIHFRVGHSQKTWSEDTSGSLVTKNLPTSHILAEGGGISGVGILVLASFGSDRVTRSSLRCGSAGTIDHSDLSDTTHILLIDTSWTQTYVRDQVFCCHCRSFLISQFLRVHQKGREAIL